MTRLIMEHPEYTKDQIEDKVKVYTNSVNSRLDAKVKISQKKLKAFAISAPVIAVSLAVIFLGIHSSDIVKQIEKTKRTKYVVNALSFSHKSRG